jgi:tetratricopeptide (TPR) repeat protein
MNILSPRRPASWSFYVGLAAVVAGCGTRVSGSRDHAAVHESAPAAAVRTVSLSEVQPPPDRDDPDIGRLTPRPNADGILVCEPITTGADSKAAAFGAGAARWLHLVVGGRPELGRQVAWVGPERVREEMGRPDLRLSVAEAARAAKMAGAGVVAVGSVSGTPASMRIQYQLYDAPAMMPRGKPLAVQGTMNHVAAALPGMAVSILQAMGVTARPDLNVQKPAAEDLAAVAEFPWQCKAALTEDQLTAVEALARRSPVAGIAAFESITWQDGDETKAAADRLLRQLPNNVLILSDIGRCAAGCLEPRAAEIQKLIAAHPKNYLLTRLGPRISAAPTTTQALKTLRAAVQLSPGNPDAWISLSDALSDEADSVRHAQVWASMTAGEGAFVTHLYPQAVAAAIRAVRIDPQYALAWRTLSSAAAFNGNDAMSDDALAKALKLNPANYDANWWALQVYQPKWFADDAKLAAAAKSAAAQRYDSPFNAVRLSLYLKGLNFQREAETLRTQGLDELAAAVKRKPASYSRRTLWMEALRDTGDVPEAITQAKENIRLHPKNMDARAALGELYLYAEDTASAEKTFRDILASSPAYRWANVKLGMTLTSTNRWKEGEAELRKGVPAFPKYAPGHLALGYALEREQKWTEAAKELGIATSLAPTNGEAWDNLTRVLNQLGRYPEAMTAAERGAVYNENRPISLSGVGEALYGVGRYDESAAVYEEYIQHFPNDPGIYMLYAKTLKKLGRGAEADKAARECIRLAPKSPAAAIAKKLLSKPQGVV